MATIVKGKRLTWRSGVAGLVCFILAPAIFVEVAVRSGSPKQCHPDGYERSVYAEMTHWESLPISMLFGLVISGLSLSGGLLGIHLAMFLEPWADDWGSRDFK